MVENGDQHLHIVIGQLTMFRNDALNDQVYAKSLGPHVILITNRAAIEWDSIVKR